MYQVTEATAFNEVKRHSRVLKVLQADTLCDIGMVLFLAHPIMGVPMECIYNQFISPNVNRGPSELLVTVICGLQPMSDPHSVPSSSTSMPLALWARGYLGL